MWFIDLNRCSWQVICEKNTYEIPSVDLKPKVYFRPDFRREQKPYPECQIMPGRPWTREHKGRALIEVFLLRRTQKISCYPGGRNLTKITAINRWVLLDLSVLVGSRKSNLRPSAIKRSTDWASPVTILGIRPSSRPFDYPVDNLRFGSIFVSPGK